jgi:hypothetical protein
MTMKRRDFLVGTAAVASAGLGIGGAAAQAGAPGGEG